MGGVLSKVVANDARRRALIVDTVSAKRSALQGSVPGETKAAPALIEARDPIGRPKKRKVEDAFFPNDELHERDPSTPPPARSGISSTGNNFPSRSSFPLSASQAAAIDPSILSNSGTHSVSPQGSNDHAATGTAAADVPSLADLSVAAFLQSLDSLEITPPEGYLLQSGSTSSSGVENGGGSSQGWDVSGSAILDPNISYAVPADFSWWDIAGLGGEIGLNNEEANQAAMSSTSTAAQHAPLTIPTSDNPIPTALASPRWPRGREGGMGQGKLTTEDGTTYEARDWNGKDREQQQESRAGKGSEAEPRGADTSDSCCKKNTAPQLDGEASIASGSKPIAEPTGISLQAEKPCCSKKAQSDVAVPATTSSTLTIPNRPSSSSSSGSTNAADSQPQGKRKVFCVPNPNGKGCTCLCDMGVALISVRKTLRAASVAAGEEIEHQPLNGTGAKDSASNGTSGAPTKSRANATTTLQLTLSASQAVATHCACSAECPTCRSDPSTQMSASLLVSTALQIYARAVKTLKEGVGGALGVMGGGKADLDVKIGEWKPSEANARKIALYAMKLELTDLRKALGKVSNMAKGSTSASASGNDSGRKSPLLNTIDQMVIDKLHAQLGEILETVIAD